MPSSFSKMKIFQNEDGMEKEDGDEDGKMMMEKEETTIYNFCFDFLNFFFFATSVDKNFGEW